MCAPCEFAPSESFETSFSAQLVCRQGIVFHLLLIHHRRGRHNQAMIGSKDNFSNAMLQKTQQVPQSSVETNISTLCPTIRQHSCARLHCTAAWSRCSCCSQEARAKDMISQLKLEMNNLTRLVEAGAGLSIGEEATMNELLKQKEDLTKERDAQVCCHSLH